MQFRGTVDQGNLTINDPAKFRAYLAKLGHKDVSIVIKAKGRSRSLRQNQYYWGVVIKLISEYTGYSPDEAHDAMRWKFLSIPGDLPSVKSTAKLSTVEMEEYLERIRQWSAEELGMYIPDPNENMTPEF